MQTVITKAEASDGGCWIDGHWGRFGSVRLVEIAVGRGRKLDEDDDKILDRLLAELSYRGPSAEDDDWEALLDQGNGLADKAEEWLNEHVAPEGYWFGWHDGEFFLWPNHVWHDDDPSECGCEAAEIAVAQGFL